MITLQRQHLRKIAHASLQPTPVKVGILGGNGQAYAVASMDSALHRLIV
jgi:hypothetical protein